GGGSDPPRWCPLHGRGGDLRAAAPEPGPRRLRLPRGVPRARGGGGGGALRGRRGVRAPALSDGAGPSEERGLDRLGGRGLVLFDALRVPTAKEPARPRRGTRSSSEPAHALLDLLRRVRAAAVQLLVAGHEV